MISGIGTNARKAIFAVRVKNTAPISSVLVNTWIKSLAPPFKKRSS
jgi:hypothetical protein